MQEFELDYSDGGVLGALVYIGMVLGTPVRPSAWLVHLPPLPYKQKHAEPGGSGWGAGRGVLPDDQAAEPAAVRGEWSKLTTATRSTLKMLPLFCPGRRTHLRSHFNSSILTAPGDVVCRLHRAGGGAERSRDGHVRSRAGRQHIYPLPGA